MPHFDLASLTKPLVTAPLALAHLDLDQDRRSQLGLAERPMPLSVRQLLSHRSGLPPWLPYTGEPLAAQLRRGFPAGAHPLLREANPSLATYSDLNFRLLAELLELETGRPFAVLGGEATGFHPAPYPEAPVALPDGPDAAAWSLAAPHCPLVPQAPGLPHDANARAGMPGHAGFAATPEEMRTYLATWLETGWPRRMAQPQADGEDGTLWGLGLQRVFTGPGRLGDLLDQVSEGLPAVTVLVDETCSTPEPAPALEGPAGPPSPWWFHFGYTGCAVFVHPEAGKAIALMLHRLGPDGRLLDMEGLRGRRWALLARGHHGSSAM